MNFFDIKEAIVYKLRANFCCVWTLEGLVEKKNKIWLEKKLGKKWLFCFFLLELLACHLITKTCKHLVQPSLFDAKKFHIFWIFLLFFEFTVHRLTYLLFFLWHELLECTKNTKLCTHLTNLSIFVPTNFQIF